jgi:hypothetical protein
VSTNAAGAVPDGGPASTRGPVSPRDPASPRGPVSPRDPVSPPVAASSAPRLGSVRVAEVTAEGGLEDPPELPLHLAGAPGTVAVQLRTTVRRVAVGAGLARKAELLEAVRALPGLPGLATSPAGGTFVMGGPGWLGLCAVGVPPPERGMPLDWLNASLSSWFRSALAGFGVRAGTGRVEGGWCPGFSDISVNGRKLIGLGYRVTREWVVMRGMMAVAPIAEDDMDLLVACHRLIGIGVVPAANTSLAEAAGAPGLSVAEVIERWRDVRTGAG